MENLQNKLNQIREKIQAMEGVEKTSSHYENKAHAYAVIDVYFNVKARDVRELLDYLSEKMPATVRPDVRMRTQDRDCYLIELTASGKRDERTREMKELLSSLEANINDYFQKKHERRKEFGGVINKKAG